MWQKARILSVRTFHDVVGRECWVRPPKDLQYRYYNGDVYQGRGYPTNISNIPGYFGLAPMVLPIATAELLPEFADDVPLVDFETWRKEQI